MSGAHRSVGFNMYQFYYYCTVHGWVPRGDVPDSDETLRCPIMVGMKNCNRRLRTRVAHKSRTRGE